jgi:hypothetical protein
MCFFAERNCAIARVKVGSDKLACLEGCRNCSVWAARESLLDGVLDTATNGLDSPFPTVPLLANSLSVIMQCKPTPC